MREWHLGLAMFVGFWLAMFALVYFGRRASRAQGDPLQEQPPREPIRRDFPGRRVPRGRVPRPLPLCEDAVGGIESITIAGKRYWFGFSHSADAVLSPLIDDPKLMAQFASDHLLQRDNNGPQRREVACPPEYWNELVEAAIHESDLTGGERDYTGREFADLRAQLDEARRTARPVEVSTPPAHLVYLLGAASGEWDSGITDATLETALGELARGDWFEGALSVVSGANPPPSGTEFTAVVDALCAQVENWRRITPENWKALLLGR